MSDNQWTGSGERNRRIVIQVKTTSPDKYGAPQEAWQNATVPLWAKIATVSSREVYLAGQFTSRITHVINIVWSASLHIENEMQVLYRNRTFLVQGVENRQEADREFNLMCIEIDGVIA